MLSSLKEKKKKLTPNFLMVVYSFQNNLPEKYFHMQFITADTDQECVCVVQCPPKCICALLNTYKEYINASALDNKISNLLAYTSPTGLQR